MPRNDFVWYELMTTDLRGAASFYHAVLGWTLDDAKMSPVPYLVITTTQGCGGIGGMMQLTPQMQVAGAPKTWIGYLYAEDVDAATASLKAAGGTVHREPGDIPGVGRFAVVADPQGAIFNLFKPTPPEGVERIFPDSMDPGNVSWRELMTTDWEKAWEFYTSQFGWMKAAAFEMGPVGTYQTFHTNEAPVPTGGMMTLPAAMRAPDMPAASWQFYFNVPDILAAKTAVERNGGTVTHGPAEVPGGGMILNVRDPQGVTFCLIQHPAH